MNKKKNFFAVQGQKKISHINQGVKSFLFLKTVLLGFMLIFFPLKGFTQQSSLRLFTDRTLIVPLSTPAAEVFIANPEIADVHLSSTKTVYIIGKKAGTTTLIVSDGKGKIILERTIQVGVDHQKLKQALSEALNQEKIEIREAPEGIIVQGSVSSATELDTAMKIIKGFVGEKTTIINNLTVDAPLQINLRVKIIEVARTVKNNLGINWDATLKTGNFAFGTFTGTQFANPTWSKAVGLLGGTPAGPFTMNSSGTTGNNFAAKLQTPQVILNTLLSALESEGLVTTLAEPNLTAISGQAATFLSGGELGILIPGTLGSPPTVEYKSYGISLEFKPTVLEKGRINVYVKPEVSFPDYSSAISYSSNGVTTTIPNILTRRAETVVELGSGESFVIAGLLYNDLTNQIQKTPGLGDIPGLGALFRQASVTREDSEVMIVVTPYIVEPINGHPISSPTDGMKVSSLNEMFFQGKLTESDQNPQEPDSNLAGDAGFDVEEA